MEIYDVIIIGAGPAGLMAARTLGERPNINFLILDSKKEIGLPLRCGEGIRKDGFIELFEHSKYYFVMNKTNTFEIHSKNVSRSLYIDYLILDRPKFEQWLAEPIKDHIILQSSVIDVIRKKEYMEVVANKGCFRARLVILSYGCNFSIQRKFSLIKNAPSTIPCIGGIFKNHNLDPSRLYFYFDDDNGTASWIFPKDKIIANVGMGILPKNKGKNLTYLFNMFAKEHELIGKPSYSGIFPTNGAINKSYSKRMIVCGNAAGQVYAGAGEGIYFALKAGKIAGKVALNAVNKNDFSSDYLKRYEMIWKHSFGDQIKASLVFADILVAGLNNNKLDYIFSLPTEKELVDLFMHGKVSWRAYLAMILIRAGRLLRLGKSKNINTKQD
ncbi:MAG: NAD(P)/FAD-dependent oxidoreductase [Candidatus Woesearchaeota archaeon]